MSTDSSFLKVNVCRLLLSKANRSVRSEEIVFLSWNFSVLCSWKIYKEQDDLEKDTLESIVFAAC